MEMTVGVLREAGVVVERGDCYWVRNRVELPRVVRVEEDMASRSYL